MPYSRLIQLQLSYPPPKTVSRSAFGLPGFSNLPTQTSHVPKRLVVTALACISTRHVPRVDYDSCPWNEDMKFNYSVAVAIPPDNLNTTPLNGCKPVFRPVCTIPTAHVISHIDLGNPNIKPSADESSAQRAGRARVIT